MGQGIAPGHQHPVFGDDALRYRLVERLPAGHGATSHVGDAQRVQHIGQRAVLAGRAVDQRDDHVRRVVLQCRQQGGIEVEHTDIDAFRAQRFGQSAPRAQRHIAFGGQTTGEHNHGHWTS